MYEKKKLYINTAEASSFIRNVYNTYIRICYRIKLVRCYDNNLDVMVG